MCKIQMYSVMFKSIKDKPLKFIILFSLVNRTGCLIFLLVGCAPWLRCTLRPSFCSLSFQFRKRSWTCQRSLDRKWGVCCSFLLLFFFFPLLSFFLTLGFLWFCLRKRVGFRCGIWCLNDDGKGTVVFGFRFFLFFAPAEGPVGFSSGVVVDFDAGLVGLSDVGFVSTAHLYCV